MPSDFKSSTPFSAGITKSNLAITACFQKENRKKDKTMLHAGPEGIVNFKMKIKCKKVKRKLTYGAESKLSVFTTTGGGFACKRKQSS